VDGVKQQAVADVAEQLIALQVWQPLADPCRQHLRQVAEPLRSEDLFGRSPVIDCE
jgi:hypothetical protein